MINNYDENTILDRVESPSGVYENVSIRAAIEQLECTEAQILNALNAQFPPEPSDKKRDRLCYQLDADAGTVRSAVVSPGQFVDQEYLLAYEHAVQWKDSGFSGDAPLSVKYWSDSSELTAQEAAEDIISTRKMFYVVLLEVRRIRLAGKDAIKNAQPEDIESTYHNYRSELFNILNQVQS